MSRDVRMSMQDNINTAWRIVRRYMSQSKFQPASDQIKSQRPFEITVAISSNKSHSWSKRAKLVEDCFSADVPQVPDFIGAFGHFTHSLRQTIVRIGEDENAPVFLL